MMLIISYVVADPFAPPPPLFGVQDGIVKPVAVLNAPPAPPPPSINICGTTTTSTATNAKCIRPDIEVHW